MQARPAIGPATSLRSLFKAEATRKLLHMQFRQSQHPKCFSTVPNSPTVLERLQ